MTLLACVLGLDSADSATVGAVAVPLKHAMQIDDTRIGLLVTVSTVVGACASLPMGSLVDRVPRVRLLVVAILLWSAAMFASSFATSFDMLLVIRLALGAVVAVAGPAVASLTGDYFPAQDRGRVFSFILTGELVGSGVGYLIAGNLAAVSSWRLSFGVLAVPGIFLAGVLHRRLPEPERGGQSQLAAGAETLTARAAASGDDRRGTESRRGRADERPGGSDEGLVQQQVRAAGIRPAPDRILKVDGSRLGLLDAVRYVLSIRTNVLFIVSSAIGYFFYSGLRVFAIEFLRGRFGLGQSAASSLFVALSAGSLLGVLIGGQTADREIRRGAAAARPVVAGLAFLATAVVLLPGLLTTSLLIAAPLMFLATGTYAAVNAPLDAARLDVVVHAVWGRGEAIRTALRSLLVASAPLVFGALAQHFGRHSQGIAQTSGDPNQTTLPSVIHGARGLDRTFLIMLVPLAVTGIVLATGGRRFYPADVANAMASETAGRSAASSARR